MSKHDHVYERDGKWYWFDETFDEYGPYDTQQKAYLDMIIYVSNELKKKQDEYEDWT